MYWKCQYHSFLISWIYYESGILITSWFIVINRKIFSFVRLSLILLVSLLIIDLNLFLLLLFLRLTWYLSNSLTLDEVTLVCVCVLIQLMMMMKMIEKWKINLQVKSFVWVSHVFRWVDDDKIKRNHFLLSFYLILFLSTYISLVTLEISI